MAVIALYSVKGAPWVSTTALGLALNWPRPVILVGADLSGDSLPAGYLRGSISHDRGLTSLQIDRYEHAASWSIHDHLTQLSPKAQALVGLPDAAAAAAARSLWGDLSGALQALEIAGTDAIVDIGRLSLAGTPDRNPLLTNADLRLLVTTSSLSDAVAVTRYRDHPASVIRNATQVDGLATDLTLVANPDRPFSVREISKITRLPCIGTIAFDPTAASVYAAGVPAPRHHTRRQLVRDYSAVVDAARGLLEQNARTLIGESR